MDFRVLWAEFHLLGDGKFLLIDSHVSDHYDECYDNHHAVNDLQWLPKVDLRTGNTVKITQIKAWLSIAWFTSGHSSTEFC